MKISENSKCDEMKFSELKCGDVFLHTDYLMKTHEVNDEITGICNAVNLAGGTRMYLPDYMMVQPVDCELHIK